MAENPLSTDLTCAICLELLQEPVTIPCGHSFCRSCVQSHWDAEKTSECSCPECRESFSPRPVLVRNFKMAALVEQMKEAGPTVPPGGGCVAGPGDVSCDVCTGRKLKAVYSCLQCLVSYCERHLQPHRDVAGLQKHQLVAPSDNLQEHLCSKHNEQKKMFCRTDQQLLCAVCVDQHKGHDLVSSAAERAQKQTPLEDRKVQLLKTISDSETVLRRLQEEAQAISRSAQDAVQRSGDSFTNIILLLEKRRSDVEQQIKDQEKSELRRVQELQDQVQLDIAQRKKTVSEMDTLLKTLDNNYFLRLYSNLPSHGQPTAVSEVLPEELLYFESVTKAVSALKENIQLRLTQSETEVSTALREVHTLLTCRQGFLKYACDITLDPNTAHRKLILSEGNRRVKYSSEEQRYPQHPERSETFEQVLSREALTGRCYWEVERTGRLWVFVAVAYKDINKTPDVFGCDKTSWALLWSNTSYSYCFDKVKSQIPGPSSSRLGVFLDHRAGLLSFYRVTDQTLSLIHSLQTKFTQPLYVGVRIYKDETTVYFPQIKKP